ncbi:MAG: hypothetical protein KDE33_25015 [Bacteroidetes bacterium]|nr:hypothetical protein [Bacteroidota bacterium]
MTNSEVVSYFPSAKCIKVYKSENYTTDYLFLIKINRNNIDKPTYSIKRSSHLEKNYEFQLKLKESKKKLEQMLIDIENQLAIDRENLRKTQSELNLVRGMKRMQKTNDITTKTGEPTEEQMKDAIINRVMIINRDINASANYKFIADTINQSVQLVGFTSEDTYFKISSFKKISCKKLPDRQGCFSCNYKCKGEIKGRIMNSNDDLIVLVMGIELTNVFIKNKAWVITHD